MPYYTRIVWDLETLAVIGRDEVPYDGPFDLLKQTQQQKDYNAQQIRKSGLQLGAAPGYQAQAQQASGTLLPAYQNIIANPGYSDAEKSAMTSSTLGGIGAGYAGAKDDATRRAARTGNDASFTAGLDDLARSQARDVGTAETGLQSKFADTRLRERDKAMSGLSNLYGLDTRTLTELLSGQNPNFNNPPGFWGNLGNAIAGGIGARI